MMNNRNKAFTLLELMLAIAILVVIVGMITPLLSSITKSNKKAQELNEVDLNIGKSLDTFKRAVRSSNNMTSTFGGITGTTSAIYLSETNGDVKSGVTTSSAIVINVPKEGTPVGTYVDEKVIFYYDSVKKMLMLNSTDDTTHTSFSGVTGAVELVNNVQNVQFTYQNNIATIYMEVKLDKKGSNTEANNFKKVRDAAVTRININF